MSVVYLGFLNDGRIYKMLYEKVGLPTIIYNMESTTNMPNKEMEEMEMIQGNMLRKISNVCSRGLVV